MKTKKAVKINELIEMIQATRHKHKKMVPIVTSTCAFCIWTTKHSVRDFIRRDCSICPDTCPDPDATGNLLHLCYGWYSMPHRQNDRYGRLKRRKVLYRWLRKVRHYQRLHPRRTVITIKDARFLQGRAEVQYYDVAILRKRLDGDK